MRLALSAIEAALAKSSIVQAPDMALDDRMSKIDEALQALAQKQDERANATKEIADRAAKSRTEFTAWSEATLRPILEQAVKKLKASGHEAIIVEQKEDVRAPTLFTALRFKLSGSDSRSSIVFIKRDNVEVTKFEVEPKQEEMRIDGMKGEPIDVADNVVFEIVDEFVASVIMKKMRGSATS
jgi:hypothetical protein